MSSAEDTKIFQVDLVKKHQNEAIALATQHQQSWRCNFTNRPGKVEDSLSEGPRETLFPEGVILFPRADVQLTLSVPKTTHRPPLTGRDDAINSLTKHVEAALAGKGSLVLVSGEAGIGKSRLLEELSEQAKAKGFRVLTGNCIPGSGGAYLPFQEVVETYFGLHREGETSRSKRLIHSVKKSGPEIAGAVPMVGGVLKLTATLYKEYHASKTSKTPEFERTLSSMLDFLREASRHEPLLVFLDDLQWADSASIQMLHFLARNCVPLQVVLIGTYRPEELHRETEGKEHALLSNLRVMRREGISDELSLDRLNTEHTRVVVEGMLGSIASEDLVHRIVTETSGNPLFIVETVRLLLETHAIAQKDGKWEDATQGGTMSVPSSVVEVIRRRLDELPENIRRELAYASVLGEVFEPSVLAEMLEIERIQVLEDLEHIERRFQLVKPFEGVYRFSHEKVKRVLYDGIQTELQKELHRKAGIILEKRLLDNSLSNTLSLHFCKADDKARCIKYSLLSGEDCLDKLALREAVHYFEQVIEAAGDDQFFLRERLVAFEGLGDVNIELGLLEQSLETYKAYVRLSTSPKELVWVFRKMAGAYWTSTNERLTYLSRAEEYGEIDILEAARLKIIKADLGLASARLDVAERLCLEAANVFKVTRADEDLALCLSMALLIQETRADATAAVETAHSLSELVKKLDNPRILLRVNMYMAYYHGRVGQVDQALKEADRILEISSKFGYDKAAVAAHQLLAFLHELAGDFGLFDLEAKKAYDIALRLIEDRWWRSTPTIVYAHSRVHMGAIAQAKKLRNEASRIFAGSGIGTESDTIPRDDILLDARLDLFHFHLLQAELEATDRRMTESRREFETAMLVNRDCFSAVWYEAYGRQHYAEFVLAPAGHKAEAKEELEVALKLYEKLSNNSQAERTRSSLANVG